MSERMIRLKVTTIERIDKYGGFKESYDDVINKVLDELNGKAVNKK